MEIPRELWYNESIQGMGERESVCILSCNIRLINWS